MYTIISGTNRAGSNTLKVAKEYQRILTEKGIAANLLSLEEVDFLSSKERYLQLEKDFIRPAEKVLFIVPGYNGSYPGILKLLFDVGHSHSVWWHKKALITGVSTGRAGNVKGMEHLSSVLNYLKITVFPELVPISVVDKLMDADGSFTDAATIAVIEKQLEHFIKWYN